MGGNTSNLYADIYLIYCLTPISTKLKALGVLMVRKYVDDLLIYGHIFTKLHIKLLIFFGSILYSSGSFYIIKSSSQT